MSRNPLAARRRTIARGVELHSRAIGDRLTIDAAKRDFCGYGATPPDPRWPGGARIAININLNYEAGGERCLLDSDPGSEPMLNDIGFPAYAGVRSPLAESAFEYGRPRGVWRLLPIFARLA